MRISDWRSGVCSSDLRTRPGSPRQRLHPLEIARQHVDLKIDFGSHGQCAQRGHRRSMRADVEREFAGTVGQVLDRFDGQRHDVERDGTFCRSEEHTSELQSLMRISYAVICLKKKKTNIT